MQASAKNERTDTVPLEPAPGPKPQPELNEPRLRDPGLTDLSLADWRAILMRAGREAVDDNLPMIASALAYSAFFAIPSVLLVVLGLFTLVADRGTVSNLVERLTEIAPSEAATSSPRPIAAMKASGTRSSVMAS